MAEKNRTSDDVYEGASREELVTDETDYAHTSRGEVATDETGWKGVSRGVVHHDEPNTPRPQGTDSPSQG